MASTQDTGFEHADDTPGYHQNATPIGTPTASPDVFSIRIEVQITPRTTRCHRPQQAVTRPLRRVSFFFAFHVLNSVFGVAAFAVVVVGLVLSVALLPLCGFGIIVFQALDVVTEKLAKLDVTIANLLVNAGSSETILRIHPRVRVSEFAVPDSEPAESKTDPTLSSNTAIFRVILYFVTIKPVVAVLSWIVVAFVMSFPIIAFSESRIPALATYECEYAEKPAALGMAAVGIIVLGIVLLVLLAMLSREFTMLVCADTAPHHTCDESEQ